ncbi:MAG: DUF2334 domain-containing protein [Fimbriimonadaceae bacterium]|nr:DUF2334 domain-containing protein [Fimbriimonadaceae bacterium]
MTPALVVSVHDVCPRTFALCRQILVALSAAGVRRRSLLVSPAEPGLAPEATPGFVPWLHRCAAAGDEIVLHGYHHRRDPVEPPLRGRAAWLDGLLARGAGEFVGLDQATALARLVAGRAALDRLGLPTSGFVAPAWLYSPAAATAVRQAGFDYYTTHGRLRDLRRGREHWSFGISNRPGSLAPDLVGRAVNEAFSLLHRPLPLLRLAVHPADCQHHQPFQHTLALVRRALAAGRRPLTYAEYLAA